MTLNAAAERAHEVIGTCPLTYTSKTFVPVKRSAPSDDAVDQLRRELSEKDDRIAELEAEPKKLRQVEHGVLRGPR